MQKENKELGTFCENLKDSLRQKDEQNKTNAKKFKQLREAYEKVSKELSDLKNNPASKNSDDESLSNKVTELQASLNKQQTECKQHHT